VSAIAAAPILIIPQIVRFFLGRPPWALTVTVIAGGATASKAALFRAGACADSPRVAAFHGLSRCGISPACSPVHVAPMKADENEDKTFFVGFGLRTLMAAASSVFLMCEA
jgi:hypothetical protein